MSELSAGEGGTASGPAVCLGARGQGLTPSQMGTTEGFARRPELQMTSTVPAWNEPSELHREQLRAMHLSRRQQGPVAGQSVQGPLFGW